MKNIFLMAVLGLAPFAAFAGAESHGGQVVVCPGKEVVMLDYYQATLPTQLGGTPELVDISKMTSDDVLNLVKTRLKYSSLLVPYQRALDLLGPVNTWLEGNLQSVADSDPAFTLAPNCELKQAVVRQESTVYMDPSITSQLSPAQIGILRAHEALYYVGEQNGLMSSVEVRMILRGLLKKDEDAVALSKSVHEFKNQFFWWEGFSLEFYYSGFSTLKISYDPLTDGEHMHYTLVIKQSTQDPGKTDSGTLTCDDGDPQAPCRTSGGTSACTIQTVTQSREVDQFSNIELSCLAEKLDIKMKGSISLGDPSQGYFPF